MGSHRFKLGEVVRNLKSEGIELTERRITEALDRLVLYAIFSRRGADEYELMARCLPEVVERHDSLDMLKSSWRREAMLWLNQSSSHKDR
jgi:hypothetical protein